PIARVWYSDSMVRTLKTGMLASRPRATSRSGPASTAASPVDCATRVIEPIFCWRYGREEKTAGGLAGNHDFGNFATPTTSTHALSASFNRNRLPNGLASGQ